MSLHQGQYNLQYVDDTLFFAKDDAIIDEHISILKPKQFELTNEGDVEAFLGVNAQRNLDSTIKMTQLNLIDTVIKLVGLEHESKQHKTPATIPPLHAHTNGVEQHTHWNYCSAIGMLTYLARNTRPDIKYAVHQCAQLQLNPKKAHKNAVKRICRYLNGTYTEHSMHHI